MSDLNQNAGRYSNLSSWRQARYTAYLATFETRLTALQAQISTLMDTPVEEYNFNAGDGGSQSAKYRKLKDLNDQEDWLLAQINKYNNLLWGGGIISHDLRRKG